MKKDRVAAFTDAVLAIIMTILVLELKKPSSLTVEALWDLRYSFFSYTLSFFWLGSMWVNIHNEWESIEKINAKTLWMTLVLLWIDVGIKVIGLVIALTVYPPAMMFSVIIAAGLLMAGIRFMKLDWDHMQ